MASIRKRIALFKARIKYNWLKPYLTKDDTFFDIGTGNGAVAFLLNENGFSITTSDVINKSIFKQIAPIIADGKNLPVADGSYDNVLLLTMLHHTSQPKDILKEAKRISRKRIVIIEDVYINTAQKLLTFITDSLVNLEFKGHPHSNKTELEWEETFKELGLKIKSKERRPFLIWFRQVLFVLEK